MITKTLVCLAPRQRNRKAGFPFNEKGVGKASIKTDKDFTKMQP